MDHRLPSDERWKSTFSQRVFDRGRFESRQLERLFRRYAADRRRRTVLRAAAVLSALTAVLASLTFAFRTRRGWPLAGGLLAFQSLSFASVAVWSLVRAGGRALTAAGLVSAALMLSLAAAAWPIDYAGRLGGWLTPDGSKLTAGNEPETDNNGVDSTTTPATGMADGLWETALVTFVVYTALPWPTAACLLFGLVVSTCQLLAAAFSATLFQTSFWQQLSSNFLLCFWTNIIGLFARITTEKTLRQGFLHARNCYAVRLEIGEANERLERLFASVLPIHMVKRLKPEIANRLERRLLNAFIECHENVSILFADVVGCSSLVAQCTPQDIVRFLNELFGRFDQLATENGCLRIKLLGDRYFCVSGVHERRPDHAECCVAVGLELLGTVSAVVEQTAAQLAMRVGVHSGRVVSGFLGAKKWQYDVWSNDVTLASYVENAGMPGKVHVTQATAERLNGAYELEPAFGSGKDTFLRDHGIKTYFIVAPPTRQPLDSPGLLITASGSLNCRSNKRISFRNVSNSVMQLLNTMSFRSEVPFAHVLVQQDDAKRVTVFANKLDGEHSSNSNVDISDQWLMWRKRPTTVSTNEPVNKIDKCLAHVIAARNIDQEKLRNVSRLTLRFRDTRLERQYNRELDKWLIHSAALTLLALIVFAVVHNLVLSRYLISILIFVIALLALLTAIIALFLSKTKVIRNTIFASYSGQSILAVLMLIVFSSAIMINSFVCWPSLLEAKDQSSCYSPLYILISCQICILSMSVYTRLPAFVKLALMVLMAGVYLLLITFTHYQLFYDYSTDYNTYVPLPWTSVVMIIALILLSYFHARQTDWIFRLDYLWKMQALHEKTEVVGLRRQSQTILSNLLPAHLANYFLENQFANNLDLCCQQYNKVGVMFANIANFADVYTEMNLNKTQGTECLQLLNDIICGFDEILTEEQFRRIEKIKTFGSTYMVAIGLTSECRIKDNGESTAEHLSTLVEFAFAMKQHLSEINDQTYNNFVMRIGIHVGPVVAGVIGARKPQYDLWGQTVNAASRLESTSAPGHMQTSEDVYLALRHRRYAFQSRGLMKFSNRTEMNTYFLVGRRSSTELPLNKPECKSPFFNGIPLPGLAELVAMKDKVNSTLKRQTIEFDTDTEFCSETAYGVEDRDRPPVNVPLMASAAPPPPPPPDVICQTEMDEEEERNGDSCMEDSPLLPSDGPPCKRPSPIGATLNQPPLPERWTETEYAEVCFPDDVRPDADGGAQTGVVERPTYLGGLTSVIGVGGVETATVADTDKLPSAADPTPEYAQIRKLNADESSDCCYRRSLLALATPVNRRKAKRRFRRHFEAKRRQSVTSSEAEDSQAAMPPPPMHPLKFTYPKIWTVSPLTAVRRAAPPVPRNNTVGARRWLRHWRQKERTSDSFVSSDSENDAGRWTGGFGGAKSPLTALSRALASLKPLRGEYSRPSYGDVRSSMIASAAVSNAESNNMDGLRSTALTVGHQMDTPASSDVSVNSEKPIGNLMESSVTESHQHLAPPLALAETLDDVLLNVSTHTEMPESDQALMYGGNAPDAGMYKPFPLVESRKYSTGKAPVTYAPPPLIPSHIRAMSRDQSAGRPAISNGSNNNGNVNESHRQNGVVVVANNGNNYNSNSNSNNNNNNNNNVFSETEYENAESDAPFSETDSRLLSCSPETRMLQSSRLLVPGVNIASESPMTPARNFFDQGRLIDPITALEVFDSLEYLALDAGHEADIDSLSSRCSSRIRFDDRIQSPGDRRQAKTRSLRRRSTVGGRRRGYESEYENLRSAGSDEVIYRPLALSEFDLAADSLRKLTQDIQKSFGDFKLTSFSDIESDLYQND